MTIHLAATLAFALPALSLAGPALAEERPLVVRVLVLNFDPLVREAGDAPLHEFLGQNDPRRLAEGYAADVAAASRSGIRFQIVEWKDIDAYPPVEGRPLRDRDFIEAARTGVWPEGRTDYLRLIGRYGLAASIDSGRVDEVWLFGAPGFGYWEAASAGPGAFYINGGVYPDVPVSRPFAIMGFSYERGVAEMLHDLAHRTEGTMTHFYGSWNFDYGSATADKPRTRWDRFSAAEAHGQLAGAGNCHWPPNAEKEYDYDNPREVLSTVELWRGSPRPKGRLTRVSAETWGGPDYQRGFMNWWLSHLPNSAGTGRDGRLNNWWRYVFGFNLPGGLEASGEASPDKRLSFKR